MERPLTDKPVLTFEGIVESFRTNWAEANNLSRRTLDASCLAGRDLAQIKERVPHGQWMSWLEVEGIGKDTARRLLLLAELEIAQIPQFDTMTAALSSIKEQRSLPLGDNDTQQPEIVDDEPPATRVDERETLQMRAEEAERRANQAELDLQEVRDRADVVLARDSDDSRAGDIWKETGSATQATERAREELQRMQTQRDMSRAQADKSNRKLNQIKADLLAGLSGGDVLVKHYGMKAHEVGRQA